MDALRVLPHGRPVLFGRNAFGPRSDGGRVTLARIDGDRLVLRTLVTGLDDPSSGAVAGGRVWLVESKYGLLTHRQASDGPVPDGVPFDLQSAPLPAARRRPSASRRSRRPVRGSSLSRNVCNLQGSARAHARGGAPAPLQSEA